MSEFDTAEARKFWEERKAKTTADSVPAATTKLETFWKQQGKGYAADKVDTPVIHERADEDYEARVTGPSRSSTAKIDERLTTEVQRQSAQRMPGKQSNVARAAPDMRVRPTKNFASMTDKEKAEAYFDLYDKHQQVTRGHTALEENIKTMTTQLRRLEGSVRYERRLAESVTGENFHSAELDDKDPAKIRLKLENRQLKAHLDLHQHPPRRKSPKKGVQPPSIKQATMKPKVLRANGEDGELIERLKAQLMTAESKLREYSAKSVGGMPDLLGKDLHDKARMLAQVEGNYANMQESYEAQKMYLSNTVQLLEDTKRALVEERCKTSELEVKLQTAKMAATGSLDMASRIEELMRENRRLEAQLKDLCMSPFIKEAGERVLTGTRLGAVEKDLERQSDSLRNYKETIMKKEAELSRLMQELKALTAERDLLKEDNVRCKVLVEERDRKFSMFEEQMKILTGGGDFNEFMRTLGLMKLRGEEPAWSKLDFLERGGVQLDDIPSLKRQIERLQLEKAQLAAELEKLQSLLTLKNEMDKERLALQDNESQQLRISLKAAQQRTEELARVADFRANRVVQLEKNHRLNVYDDANRVVASRSQFTIGELMGYSDEFSEADTEVGAGENVLDLWLGQAEYYELPIRQALGNGGVLSFLTVDFFNTETQGTGLNEGLNPQYNVQVSFKVKVDDFFLQYLEKDSLCIEAHASRGQNHSTLGYARIPMKALLERTSAVESANMANSVIDSAVSLISAIDGRTVIGVLRFKMRMRLPISEALRWYHERQEVVDMGFPQLKALDTFYETAPSGLTRILVITVFRCEGLLASMYSASLAPFVYFQFFTHEEIVTRTSVGIDPIYDETHMLEVTVNPGLKRYLDGQPLEFIVFDDNAPIREDNQDVIGTAQVPLSALLLDTAIEGTFPLTNQRGLSAGSIQLRIGWRDSRVDNRNHGTPLTDVWEKEAYSRIAKSLSARGLTVESAFSIFDQDQDGLISAQEFRNTLLLTLRLPFSEQEVQLLLNSLHTADGNMSKAEFKNKLSAYLSPGEVMPSWEEAVLNKLRERIRVNQIGLREAFEAFDKNRDGWIDAAEFIETFKVMQLGLSEQDIIRILRYFDPNGLGRINYNEFVAKVEASVAPVQSTPLSSTPLPSMSQASKIIAKVSELIRDSRLSLQEAFRVFDTNGDGKVSKLEFMQTFEMMKLRVVKAELEDLWNALGKDPQGFLSYNEFSEKLQGTRPLNPKPSIPELRRRITVWLKNNSRNAASVFQAFDRNHDGCLTRTEFRDGLECLGVSLNTYEIEALTELADKNKDGNISYQEFVELIQPRDNPFSTFRRLIKESGMSTADVFRLFDVDSSGLITRQEFQKGLDNMEIGFTPYEIDQILDALDIDRDNRINFREFSSILMEEPILPGSARSPVRTQSRPEVAVQDEADKKLAEVIKTIAQSGIDLQRAFNVFDKNGDGFISRPEFTQIFNDMKLGLTTQQINAMLAKVDTSGDGKISFEEFRSLFGKYGVTVREDAASARKRIRSPADCFGLMDKYMADNKLNLMTLFTKVFDSNHDSWISRDELQRSFNRLTPNPLTESETTALMAEICPTGQTQFNLQLLRTAYSKQKGMTSEQVIRDDSRKQLLQASNSLSAALQPEATRAPTRTQTQAPSRLKTSGPTKAEETKQASQSGSEFRRRDRPDSATRTQPGFRRS